MEGLREVTVKSRCLAHIVPLPGPRLQDEIVGVGARDEVGAVLVQHLLEGRGVRGALPPQFFAPPLLGEKPARPYDGECFQTFRRRRSIVAILKAESAVIAAICPSRRTTPCGWHFAVPEVATMR